MNMPGFTAETSLCKTSGLYHNMAAFVATHTNSVDLQGRLPPGLCQKARRFCQDPVRGGMWCGILDRCFDGGDVGPPPPSANPCKPGWRWVSGPDWCPRCCTAFGDNVACETPFCIAEP